MNWLISFLRGKSSETTVNARRHERGEMQTARGQRQENDGPDEGHRKKRYRWRRLRQGQIRNWPGPFYFKNWMREMDLNYVLNQLCAIIRIGAPLPRGIDAVIHEQRRAREGIGRDHPWQSLMMTIAATFVLGLVYIYNPFLLLFLLMAMTGYLAYRYRTNRSPYLLVLIVLMVIVMALAAYAYNQIMYMMSSTEVDGTAYFLTIYVLGLLLAVFGGCCSLVCLRFALANNPREAVLARLRDGLENGRDLSQVMRSLPRFFPQHHVEIVHAGEESGQLGDCLETLVSDARTDFILKNELRFALKYFLFLVLIHFAVFGFLMVRVTPFYKEIYEAFEGEATMPLSDGIISLFNVVRHFMGRVIFLITPEIAWSDFLSVTSLYGLALVLLVLVALVLSVGLVTLGHMRHNRYLRRVSDRIMLCIPVLRKFVISHNLEFISYILARLLGAGTTLDTALERAADGDLSPVYTRILRRVHRRVLAGESLTNAFRAESRPSTLPPALTGMTAVGEHSGRLPQAFEFLAAYYHEQKETQERILMKVIEPVGLLLLGIVSLGVMLEVYGLLIGIVDVLLMEMY